MFAQLDSQTVEKQNEQLSATAIKYGVRVRIRVKVRLGRRPVCIASVCLCIRPAVCIECTRPDVCIASVFVKFRVITSDRLL